MELFANLLGKIEVLSSQNVLILSSLIMALIMALVMAACAIVFTWMERKVAAFLQSRYGPMRVGHWHGVAQPVADMLKILQKEDIIPAEADRTLFTLAPVVIFIGSLLAWAAIPFAPGFIASDLDLGLLYIFAVSSLAVIFCSWRSWSISSARSPRSTAARSTCPKPNRN